MDKGGRFLEFLRRLEAAPQCDSAENALLLVTETLNGVEDEFSSIRFHPEMARTDGRIYPPLRDSERDVPGRTDIRRFRSARHNTFIGANGAIRIEEVRGVCVLNKSGLNGQTIELGAAATSHPTSGPSSRN